MTTWRLSKDGDLLGEYHSEAEAIDAREALCGLNQRDDYLIVAMRQIAHNRHDTSGFCFICNKWVGPETTA